VKEVSFPLYTALPLSGGASGRRGWKGGPPRAALRRGGKIEGVTRKVGVIAAKIRVIT